MEFKLKLPDKELKKITNNSIAMRTGAIKGLKKALLFFEADIKKKFVGRIPERGGLGNPLRVRTGYLRRSVDTYVKESSSGKIEGSIGSNVEYAAAIEFGIPERNLGRYGWISRTLKDKDNILEGQRIIIREIAKERNRLRK